VRDRAGQILRILCLVLAGLMVYRIAQVVLRVNPLARVTIPELPKLASDTNAPATAATRTNAVTGTNLIGGKMTGAILPGIGKTGTNVVSMATNLTSTNVAGPLIPTLSPSEGARETGRASSVDLIGGTNLPSLAIGQKKTDTNSTTAPPLSASISNSTAALLDVFESKTTEATATRDTNLATVPEGGTNLVSVRTNVLPVAHIRGTNVASSLAGSNLLSGGGTNLSGSTTSMTSRAGATNSGPSQMPRAGMPSPSRSVPGRAPELAPDIKARVDKIYQSELFGQIVRPQPMALLGIAGQSAFLRSPSGQTGLVKEGDSLGEIKLVRIGTNRVLVEQDGQKKELMIFEGFGGESLLPKEKDTLK
jgi:hypothetical protein